MSRELRVRPPASSSTAARVRRGVGEAEGGQAPRHRLGRHHRARGLCPVHRRAGPAVLDRGEGLEQGPEEEPLVDGPDVALTPAQCVVEAAVAEAEASSSKPRTRASRRRAAGSVGYRMGLLLLDELQTVLHGAQEAVRVGQGGGVLGGARTPPGQLREGAERRALPDRPGLGGRGRAAGAGRRTRCRGSPRARV